MPAATICSPAGFSASTTSACSIAASRSPAEALDDELIRTLPVFEERLEWFFANRPELARMVASQVDVDHAHRLLAIPSRERLVRVLRYMLDESEFLSPFGIRSLSRFHLEH